jgi:hypothetical protein
MASIGLQLREARERHGISVADAAVRLHIRAMFVEALEREDWSAVGEPVYVRGFVRNYARLVGVDPQSLVDTFNEEVGPLRVDPIQESIVSAPAPRGRFRYPLVLGAMSIMALLLVARVVWMIATPGAAGHDEVHPPQADAMTTHVAGSISGAAGLSALASSGGESKTSGQGVDLRLQLTQPCWLSVSVDGKRVVYETLPAGTVKEFRGAREITLRAGNAGGVVATIDGQQLGTLGGSGQVQDRVFAVRTPPIGQNPAHE